MGLYRKAERFYAGGFEKYGILLSKHPWVFLLSSLLLTGILGIGLVFEEYERDIEYLYTPENSRADKDRYRVKELFEDQSSTDFYAYQLVNLGIYAEIYILPLNVNENVLTTPILEELLILNKIITEVSETIDGELYEYDDICARRNGDCVISGILNLINGTDVDTFLTEPITYPTAVSTNGEPVSLPSVLGGEVLSDDKSHVVSAEVFRIRYHLIDGDDVRRIGLMWERAFLNKMSTVKTNFSQFYYSVSESLNYELDKSTSSDIIFFVITFILMITYANIVCSTLNCITTRVILSSMGVLAAAAAILASLGFCGYIRVHNINIVGVMPFLIIATGVDDMFLMMAGWLESQRAATTERVPKAYGAIGVSVTITSLTNALAFSIGTINVFPSVRIFCIYTACAVVWCYVMQMTFFGSNLELHNRRAADSRHCITCQVVPSDDQLETRSCIYVCCCRGKKGDSNDETAIEGLFKKTLPKIVLYTPVKICVLVIFAAYLGVAIWGCTLLQEGLLLNNLVPQNSYLYTYLQIQAEYFTDEGAIIYNVIDGPVDYWTTDVQQQINQLLVDFNEDEYFKDDFRLSWIDAFSRSLNGTLPSDKAGFLDALQNEFLPNNAMFKGDLSIADGEIVASRVYVQAEGLDSTTLEGQMMLKSRELASSSPLPAFPYSGAFIYYEQYVQVLPSTLLTLGVAVVACSVVCLVFSPNILIVIYLTTSVVSILAGVLGYMFFWDLSLSSITMINLIMCVGFSVDFSSHICHAFMKAEGANRNERVAIALSRSGVPVLNAGISSFVGIIVLIFSESYVFISFFRIMLLVILFSIGHALLLLPVVLSYIGPSKKQPDPNCEITLGASNVSQSGIRSNVNEPIELAQRIQ